MNKRTIRRCLCASALSLLFITSCSDVHEQRHEIYSLAVESVVDKTALAQVTYNLFKAETSSISFVESLTAEEKARLEADSMNRYSMDTDVLRDSLYAITDKAYSGNLYHFIEKRTVLYENAAQFYAKATSINQLEVLKGIVSRYSAMAYSEGERVCDPPSEVQEAYRAAKEAAEIAYSKAFVALGGDME